MKQNISSSITTDSILPTRSIHIGDALTWLDQHPSRPNTSFVSSIPDWSEFPHLSLDSWKSWFQDAAYKILSASDASGFTFFYQSDIKVDGTWVDKSFLCLKAAERAKSELLFRKVVCRAPAGTLTFGRPSYSHLLCFSKNFRMNELHHSTADIITHPGRPTWKRGMGLHTCLEIARFIQKHRPADTIVSPFCGEGAMLAAANHVGLSSIGIEKSLKRAKSAELLKIASEPLRWIQQK